MGLLPDQQLADARRAAPAVGRGHLGPPRATVSLVSRLLAGRRENGGVPAQAALQQVRAIPEREVGGVPPVHFEVELAVPTVAREAGFLGRRGAGALDRRQVLRQNEAPLEFLRPRV